MGLATASDAIVLASIARRRSHPGYDVVETPSRRYFWYGNVLVLAEPPEPGAQAQWIARHGEHFRGAAVQKRTIVWECSGSLGAHVALEAGVRGVVERSTVFVRRSTTGREHDARVRELRSEAEWDAAAALDLSIEDDSPASMRDFRRWRFGASRADAVAGRARMWGLWEAGELAAIAGAYASPDLARFTTPVTRRDRRGRGLFRALCDAIVDETMRAYPRTQVVICAASGDAAESVYRKTGFEAVGEQFGLLGECEDRIS